MSGDCLLQLPSFLGGDAQSVPEVVGRHGLGVPVSGLPEDPRGIPVGGDRILNALSETQGQALVIQRHALGMPVTEAARSAEPDSGDGKEPIETPPPEQVLGQEAGQRQGHPVPAARSGHVDRGH